MVLKINAERFVNLKQAFNLMVVEADGEDYVYSVVINTTGDLDYFELIHECDDERTALDLLEFISLNLALGSAYIELDKWKNELKGTRKAINTKNKKGATNGIIRND